MKRFVLVLILAFLVFGFTGRASAAQIYPWTEGGPTASWVNLNNNRLNICNKNICWVYDTQQKKWLDSGYGATLQSRFSGVKPINGYYPWTNGGPTAGWEEPAANRFVVCNTKYCWYYKYNSQTWEYSGGGVDISTVWSGHTKPKNGTLPWSFGGPTSGWYESNSNRVAICNTKYCWYYNYNSKSWQYDGQAIDISTVWPGVGVAAIGGVNPWTNGGPTTVWEDNSSNLFNACNGENCWLLVYSEGQFRNPFKVSTVSAWKDSVKPYSTTPSPTISTPSPTPPSPTPTPSPTPNPYDYNLDKKIDLQDVIDLIKDVFSG